MIKKPWLYLPPFFTYFLSPFILKIYSRLFSAQKCEWHPFKWRHLYFKNRLGIAGGVDKNAINLKDWERLGAGFYEVGTVTPRRQKAHSSKTIDRNIKHLSLWNHLGFPNQGLRRIRQRLLSLKKRPSPLLVNLGKNRETPIKKALKDYTDGIQSFESIADIFVINISSPNSPQLRTLFQKDSLKTFLEKLRDSTKKPLLLKLHPDLIDADLFSVIDESLSAGMDGWIFCNTTKARSLPHLFPDHGGISGKLLRPSAVSGFKKLKSYLDQKEEFKDQLLISVGGVLTPKDVLHRLELGAHLVQVYSALIFEGPHFFKKVYNYCENKKTTG